MSHKNLNPVNPNRPKRAAIVISNAAVSTTTGWPVGFWWAELTHPYFHFTEAGWEVDIFSPNGGRCEADAMSDPEDASQWQAEDVISRGYKHDPAFVKLIENTQRVDDLNVEDYDVLVVAGGQGPMFTFEKAENLQRKFVEFYESGKVTAALCHGTAILRYATLSTGDPLVKDKTVTGFANIEEDFADQAVWDAGALDRERLGLASTVTRRSSRRRTRPSRSDGGCGGRLTSRRCARPSGVGEQTHESKLARPRSRSRRTAVQTEPHPHRAPSAWGAVLSAWSVAEAR